MSNDEMVDGYCNAQTRDGGYCGLVAGYGTDHLHEGRCKYHGGASSGAPKGNQNAVKHGLYAKRSNYYDHLDGEDKAWVDALVESMLDDAPFTEDNFQKFQMLRNIAIDMHKIRRANDYTAENDLIVENYVRDEDGNPIFDDNGDYVTEADENPINMTYDRLNRTMTKQLKDLGLLDDPESQKADAGHSISEQLSKLRSEMESE